MEQKETRELGRIAQRIRLKTRLKDVENVLRTAVGAETRTVDSEKQVISTMSSERLPAKKAVEPRSEDTSVADPDLQKSVCRAVFHILSQNGFEAESCKSLALRIERRLRAKDPSMSDSYRSQYKRMIKDIRLLTPEGLAHSAPSNSQD